jgi:hypothetical protein
MATCEPIPRRRVAARIAAIVGLTFLLIAACASAFSMLVWGS